MMKIFSIIILGLIITFKVMAYEEANYEVVKQNKIYEIRKYSDRLAIETITSNEESSFRKLFNYISGNNESKEEISMTTPVTQIEKKELKKNNIIILSSAIKATYDKPFTLPILRRNEAMFKIDINL